MEKVVPIAYIELLSSLKALHQQNMLQEYKFHSLWPLASQLEQKNPWENLVKSFYDLLTMRELFYSEFTSKWLLLQHSKILDPGILCQTASGSLPCVLDVLHYLNLPLVDLPSTHRHHLKLSRERLTERQFVELFFSNLAVLKPKATSRNEVVLYMLEAYASQCDYPSDLVALLTEKFNSYACIPCAPDGTVLRKCRELVQPKAPFANLFEESDHRFPLKTLADRQLAMTALETTGMMHGSLKWELVIDRAQSVEGLMKRDQLKALEHVKLLLSTISSDYVDGKPPTRGTTIDSIKFLPVMKKPKDYPLPWYGDRYQLLSGRELVYSGYYSFSSPTDKNLIIAGSQVAFAQAWWVWLCQQS